MCRMMSSVTINTINTLMLMCQHSRLSYGLSLKQLGSVLDVRSRVRGLAFSQMSAIETSSDHIRPQTDGDRIPPALKGGIAIAKFKRYFGAIKYEKPPISEYCYDQKSQLWTCKLIISEPQQLLLTAQSSVKRNAGRIAMAKALVWLCDNNYLNRNFDPILSTPKERQEFLKQRDSPIIITPIDNHIKHEMRNFAENFNSEIQSLIDCNFKESFNNFCSQNENIENMDIENEEHYENKFSEFEFNNKSDLIYNLLTNNILNEANINQTNLRNAQLKLILKRRNDKEKHDKQYSHIRLNLSQLPIVKYKQQILDTIEKNHVVVIAGDTGCGKTTQVPQFILENEINKNNGALTNIIITQPRRLSAISMSKRVALEFGEGDVGNTIGYQVRFDKCLPSHDNGAMLFCSAGILLRKLKSNPSLKGVSHVIIDEVHERDVITDFLLVLLKRIIALNSNIRIILMSASINAHLFVKYFGDCPSFEIPGRCFPVKEYYLPDFIDKLSKKSNDKSRKYVARNPKIDQELIVDLIKYIDSKKADGAILCFLPGWAAIQDVEKLLNASSSEFKIIAVHSKLPHSMQKQIFVRPPIGLRKVVLATNIAETSLTIDDVVYVIDPGLANEIRYNDKLNVSAFGTHWVSKANSKQRSGRAGRVSSGECYRLYSKDTETAFMSEYPIPEILRVPLESVIMQSKLHCPREAVKQFLSELPQPPTNEAVDKAIIVLKSIKVLDDSENLTALGKSIINFSTHPRLSVSLVYSSIFGCLTSMLNVVSHLSATREAFQVIPNQRSDIRKIKKDFSCSTSSDHVALAHLTTEFENASIDVHNYEFDDFCSENLLNRFAMDNIIEMKKLIASHLEDAYFIKRFAWKKLDEEVNCNWNHKQLLIASLIAGMNPNFVKLIKGEIKNDKIIRDKMVATDVNNGQRVKFSSDSLFSEKDIKYENGLLTYFGSFFSQEARMLTIRDASLISPICLILFSDKNLNITTNGIPNECVVTLDGNKHLQFKINAEDMQLISEWRLIKDKLVEWFVFPKPNTKSNVNNQNLSINDRVFFSLRIFVKITRDLLEYYSED